VLTACISIVALFSSKWAPLHKRLLPWSGGILVGLSLFWVLPGLAQSEGWPISVAGMSAGVILLLLFDRYVYPVCPFCALGVHQDHSHGKSPHVHYHQVSWPLLVAGCIHNFFDGWMIELARIDTAGRVSNALSWGFAAHKIPESFAVGILASAFTSKTSRGLSVIMLVQAAFAMGSIAVMFAHGLNLAVVDACIAAAGATLLFFGLSALQAEWRVRGALTALRVGTLGIGACAIVAAALRLIGY
jgi:zinc transporter ZupT